MDNPDDRAPDPKQTFGKKTAKAPPPRPTPTSKSGPSNPEGKPGPLPDRMKRAETPDQATTNETEFDRNLSRLGDEGAADLKWAAEAFSLDLTAMLSSSQGIRELQTWLSDRGLKVLADGILGPGTVTALRNLRTETSRGGSDDEADFDESARPVALSDRAIASLEEDTLGFESSVQAAALFLLSAQTKPPLAMAINAPWGRGKTSFMNMVDRELQRASQTGGVEIATTWFNPWKYSEPQQVWAAFVANIVRCIEGKLGFRQAFRFRLQRWIHRLRRHGNLSLGIRGLVALAFLFLIGALLLLDWSSLEIALFTGKSADPLLKAIHTAATQGQGWSSWLGGGFLYLAWAAALLLGLTYLYVSFTKKLGLNLLEYIEKTDFKDKIGTLSQFEGEMKRLSESVPANLKIVVFIDDLDRCKGPVLGEIVEALQLADVSRTCIFILGMDLHIVANVIEGERKELAHSVGTSERGLEHGSGYKFLEKVIQARLSLPAYGKDGLEELVGRAMSAPVLDEPLLENKPREEDQETPRNVGAIAQAVGRALRLTTRDPPASFTDSEAVVETAKYYGSRHFENPRRVKRFINGFRLQAYLAPTGPAGVRNIDRLARFLVLSEKWPAALDHFLQSPNNLERWLNPNDNDLTLRESPERELHDLARQGLREGQSTDFKRLRELLKGRNGEDIFDHDTLVAFADWYGFCFYRGLNSAVQ